jgi:hypothetical protein
MTTPTMPDTVRALRTLAAADAGIAELVGDSVFARKLPEGATPPLVLIPPAFATPGAPPTPQWWDVVATFDLHAETVDDANDLLKAVLAFVPTVAGGHDDVVVSDCQAEAIQELYDAAWTPPRHRYVVTVALTAREP